MLKFVYALISSEDDYITEQAYVSMYSLKRHNPTAEITLVTDQDTFDSLEGERARIKGLIHETVVANVPGHFNPTERSRFLKTSLRGLVRGDFLYLDNDTVVTGSLSGLEKFPGDIGAVKDHHEDAVKDGRLIHGQIYDYLAKTRKKFWENPVYFNGGVLLVKDTEASNKFFDDWHRLWNEEREKLGIKLDQPSLAQTNETNHRIIKELKGDYNCQFLLASGKPYIFSAKIYHYYANSDIAKHFPLNDKRILTAIRSQGITPEIEETISCPLKAHLQNSLILSGEPKDIYNSPLVILARILATKHKWTNHIARVLFKIHDLSMNQ